MSFTVTDVPGLPETFTDTFTSRTVATSDVTLHAVVGGDGPPLLLLPGWPQFWYSWREAMPALAEHFTVIAPDLRGMGNSDKPATGYDAGTLADDVAELMTGLGYDRFAVVGYDLGMLVGYALAASHRDRVTHLVGAESILPGLTPLPPMLTDPTTTELLSHFVINRLADLNERLIAGREEIYFGHQFTTKTATPGAIPQHAFDLYVDHLRDPAARRASFEYYRTLDTTTEQVLRWKDEGPLTIPVLAIGGQYSTGTMPEEALRMVATNVTGLVIPGVGHFLPEEAPKELTAAVLDFLQAGAIHGTS
jgi:pimeloyl-ACP methyl ester carboxylesterase